MGWYKLHIFDSRQGKMIGCCEHGKELFVALDVGNSVTA
jgi:hypothetical protein